MKLSKTIWLFIGTGIFVIALAVLVSANFRQTDELNSMKEELAQNQTRINLIQIASLSAEKTELENELSQSTRQLEQASREFSQPFGSINVSTVLFDAAALFNLEIADMTSTPPVTEILEDETYSVVSLTATVTGDVSRMVDFVTGINQDLPSGTVKSITIDIYEPGSGNVTTGVVNLVAYTYQGAQ